MQVLTFAALTPTQREAFYDFVQQLPASGHYADLASMEQRVAGAYFEQGKTYLTLWDACGQPLGGMGVILREVPAKAIAYVTGLHLAAAGVAPLLHHAVGLISGLVTKDEPVTVRVGMRSEQQRELQPVLEACGLGSPYSSLEMELTGTQAWPAHGVTFKPVGPAHLDAFLRVHNAAFAQVPNGSTLTPDELQALLREAGAPLWLQVGFVDDNPVAILQLKLMGNVGWIDALGVEPAMQGRGLGRAALGQGVLTLQQLGAGSVRLHVADRNVSALELYRRSGFAVTQVTSCWLESSLAQLKQHFGC